MPAALLALFAASPGAAAQEVFGGVYAHGVETPFTFDTFEGGTDIVIGYRFESPELLEPLGSPQPYVVGSLNTSGDTSFAGGGLAWTLGKGPVFVRPGVGLVVHDGPGFRLAPDGSKRTDLGSRVLFEPEIALGYRVNPRLSVEASWMHVSHARIFNSGQNPGIDMMGVRLNLRVP
ncbi:acyloxyacyl hydrolase [Paraurantiacibacter namhicola]|uniref:acyloxyacyl hydrolase n=1 Tax=Paraurantiacibacter namhicola TaxID=645517 RepID=UPI000A8CE6DB|nr:acyloxyacyl hydrolase [Paraurantiacibacter namhicola]